MSATCLVLASRRGGRAASLRPALHVKVAGHTARRVSMSVIETRSHQMFPVLDAGQIETAKRFASGPARDFAPGEVVFDTGVPNAPAWLVLKGSIDVVRRDGLNRETFITTHHPGQ